MQENKQSAEDWAWEKIRLGEIADFNAEFGKLDPRKPDGWRGLIPLSQITPHLAFEERGTRSGAGAGVLREA